MEPGSFRSKAAYTLQLASSKVAQIATLGKTSHAAQQHMQQIVALPDELKIHLAEAVPFTFTKENPAPHASLQKLDTLHATVELDTFVAGAALQAAGFKPAVLNMANEWAVGGVWCHARGSQEESLMRRSSLPLSLWPRRSPDDHRMRGFVERAEAFFPMSEAGVVYSPHVLVLRGADEALLPEAETCTLSVLSVAAQDLRWGTTFDEALTEEKIRSMLYVASEKGHDALVLGAFGCGAFGNDPTRVASLFAKLLSTEFTGFRVVVFAIVFSQKNLKAFAEHFPLLQGESKEERVASLQKHVR
jgi:uncharacterized protein (TIGR02452 family)